MQEKKIAAVRAEPDHEFKASKNTHVTVAHLPFESEGRWTVFFSWKAGESKTGPSAPGQSSSDLESKIRLEVDVTPPGPQSGEIVIYLFPFIVVGSLWTLHTLKRARQNRKSKPKI